MASENSKPIQLPVTQDGALVRGPSGFIVAQVSAGPGGTSVTSENTRAHARAAQIVEALNTAPALAARVAELEKALNGLLSLDYQPGENANDAFERLGEMFYADTGMLRPGKDQAAALNGTPTYEERQQMWDGWIQSFYSAARAALKGGGK